MARHDGSAQCMRILPCPAPRQWYQILRSLLLVIAFSSLSPNAYGADAAFERIRQSLPQREAGWTIVETDGPRTLGDGTREVSFVWAKGSEEVTATVTLHKSLKAAKAQFKNSGEDGSLMRSFMIDGVGDEAFLFPPIIRNQSGPFNLTFRKARYVVWMNASLKDTILRCAKHIVGSIIESRSVRDGP